MTSASPHRFPPSINYPPPLPLPIPILFIMFLPPFLRAVDVRHVGPSFRSPLLGMKIIYAPTQLFPSLSLTIISLPKSAQLPPPSRLSNATPAPTPVSPPSHSPPSIVSNDYSTSNQLNKFRRYINIGDPIAVLGQIDLVSGSVDLRL